MKKNAGTYFKQKKISRRSGLAKSDYGQLKKILRNLAKQGMLEKKSGNCYRYPSEKRKVQGIISFSTKGFSFVNTDDGEEIFIGASDSETALHHDRVWVKKYKKSYGKRPEGKVIKIASRSNEPVFGILKREPYGWVAIPESPAPPIIFYILEGEKELEEGKMVQLEDIIWRHPDHYPQAKVTSVLGSPEDPANDLIIVKKMFGLEEEFPDDVQKEVSGMELPDLDSLSGDRFDFRDRVVFTIDPETAKDFDDGVSLDKSDDGHWLLGVHIADVSHYVKEKSAVDNEALQRGTSVYLGDNVVPMLPEKLSNHLCSLVPNQERLSFSVLIELSNTGRVLDFLITPGLIKSDYRFSYQEAQKIIDRGEGQFYEKLQNMNELAKTLHNRRKKYGSVDFDIPEPIFELDEQGMPHEVRPSERLETHRMIEEFMLLANKCIARRIAVHRKSEKLPFIYRVHESPSREKIIGLYDILNRLGINLKMPKNFQTSDMAEILNKIEDYPFHQFIEQISLRSMEKAIYTEEPKSHFGLGFEHYTHFTSPIRRYPDLIIHRLLKKYHGGCDQKLLNHYREKLPKIAKKATKREINAMGAEREFTKLKQIRFISSKIGQKYKGVITGVIEAGIFVEIPDYLIEGMVPVRKMNDDYYVYDEENHQLKGRHNNKTYRLGDIVEIQVVRVSLSDREIDFELINS
ncbi:MAG: ribonuclease R [Candidatus Marinimicrobia bacterium]|nr:ribonuclease R [Candidatus Neomarinimicrobiota bacterium]